MSMGTTKPLVPLEGDTNPGNVTPSEGKTKGLSMDSWRGLGSNGEIDGQDLSVQCPSHPNFSTGQDPEPSPARYPPKPTSDAFLGAPGPWEGAQLMGRHPRLALIQLLQEIRADIEPAEPRLCWWFYSVPQSPLWSTDLFGTSAAALAQGSRPFLGRIRASANNHDPAAFLLHQLGQFSGPRSVFVECPTSIPKVQSDHKNGFGMT